MLFFKTENFSKYLKYSLRLLFVQTIFISSLSCYTASSAAATTGGSWTKVADENGGFTLSSTRLVRYGAGSSWIERSLSGTVSCSNATFGDPIAGVAKECDLLDQPAASGSWTKVADENGSFTLSSTRLVRYGAGSSWIERSLSGTVSCSNATFGDPISGTQKECDLLDTSVAAPAVAIDWNSPNSLQISPQIYGINVWDGIDPLNAKNVAYQSALANLQPKLIRFHAAEMISGLGGKNWLAADGVSWNEAAIVGSLSSFAAFKGVPKILTIPKWPAAWSETNGKLKTTMFYKYGEFVASLANIVVNKNKFDINYFEPINELGGLYANDAATLGNILNICAYKIKQFVPNAEIVGGAWEQPYDTKNIAAFVQATAGTYSRFSYHNYATGSNQLSDTDLFARPKEISRMWDSTKKLISAVPGTPSMKLFLGEYNIYYSWTLENSDPNKRQRSIQGAVFDALIFKELMGKGSDAWAATWNERDGLYGKMAPDNSYRLSGKLFQLLSSRFQGKLVASASGNVEIAAVNSGSKKYIMFVNKTAAYQDATLDFGWWVPAGQTGSNTLLVHQITSDGFSSNTYNISTWPWANVRNLPPLSVTVHEYSSN